MLNMKNIISEYSGNFIQFISTLNKVFENKFIMFFQIHYLEGFEYDINGYFKASNIIPEHLNVFFAHDLSATITLKFLCDIDTIYKSADCQLFFEQLKKLDNNYIFYLTPYENSTNIEKSLIIKCNYEIVFSIENNNLKIKFNYYNIDNSKYQKLEYEINKLFQAPVKLKELNKTFNSHSISLDTQSIKNAVNSAKSLMNKGECYLANITYTKTLNTKNEYQFPSSQDFFISWLNIFSRYGVYLNYDDIGISSFSPERFIMHKHNFILTEPIKGTLKSQHKIPTQDDAQCLWNNKKEIYEHTLVVDLLRHDLYKVCTPESVQVFKPFFTRLAGSLLQMQSFILGEVNEHFSLGECLEKLLPAGSITGTPKKRVCEIINNLEINKRGYYTGICGIRQTNGDFETLILIRSLFQGQLGLYFGVGAGITTLSDTEAEVAELFIKLNSIRPIFSRSSV